MSFEEHPRRRVDYEGRSSVGRILLQVVGGVCVVLISFWVALQIMDYWIPPQNAVEIRVVEATYGLNCRDFKPPEGRANRVAKGNATEVVKNACGNAKNTCPFVVDVGRLGDPAPGCQKDFTVRWRCGDLERIHQVFLIEEAHTKSAPLACP